MPPGRTNTNRNVPLADALQASEPLALLMRRLSASQARFDAIAALLPEGLRGTVRPGPLDEESWALLAEHGAAASKLRQLLPRLEQALAGAGFVPVALKVKIQPKG